MIHYKPHPQLVPPLELNWTYDCILAAEQELEPSASVRVASIFTSLHFAIYTENRSINLSFCFILFHFKPKLDVAVAFWL